MQKFIANICFLRVTTVWFITVCCLFSLNAFSQNSRPFFEKSDTFNKRRFETAAISAGVMYGGILIGLHEIWYAKYPQSKFHFFNDGAEWMKMDKAGHFVSSFAECRYLFNGARWTGLNESKSLNSAVLIATCFHLSIEVMDGFSTEWGFSLADLGANIMGVGLFAVQQKLWHEQRILGKWSNHPVNYSNSPILSLTGDTQTTLRQRAQQLYGSNYAETWFKDYNATSAWLSFNIKSFFPSSVFPKWLNVAVGYGAENMYGGFANQWSQNGQDYLIDPKQFPRYRQYYLSLDIDTSKLGVKNAFLRTILDMINFIKIPAPTLEYNSLGKFHFYPIRL